MKNGYGVERYARNTASKESAMEAKPRSANSSSPAREAAEECYEGQWKNNAKHGRGVYRYVSGDVYEGDYELVRSFRVLVSMQFLSICKMLFPFGWFYKDDKHGSGVYRFVNGDVYEGQWKGNCSNEINVSKIKYRLKFHKSTAFFCHICFFRRTYAWYFEFNNV